MSRTPQQASFDILDCINYAAEFTSQIETLEEFVTSTRVYYAVLYIHIRIAEATKLIPDRLKQLFPDIEWDEIIRFRDLIIHYYWLINPLAIWNTTKYALPKLEDIINQLLERL
jgi:uncharacterized protein with HEPN domain